MPEEELTLTDEQIQVLQQYASIRQLEIADAVEAVAVQETVKALSKPEDNTP